MPQSKKARGSKSPKSIKALKKQNKLAHQQGHGQEQRLSADQTKRQGLNRGAN